MYIHVAITQEFRSHIGLMFELLSFRWDRLFFEGKVLGLAPLCFPIKTYFLFKPSFVKCDCMLQKESSYFLVSLILTGQLMDYLNILCDEKERIPLVNRSIETVSEENILCVRIPRGFTGIVSAGVWGARVLLCFKKHSS